MSRIAKAFERLKREKTRGLIAYLTAGDPEPNRTVEFILGLEKGGTDIIELGVPFSDPIADGPVIQRATERSLSAGTTLKIVIEMLRELRRKSDIPVVIFSYLNPVLRYGFEKFAVDASAAGADGVLLTDLNIEEAGSYIREMRKRELETVFLVSQTTKDDRLRLLSQSCSGFVYLVSRAGVTGERTALSEHALPLIKRTRAVTSLPLAVGFGLSKPEHMMALAPHVDAAVVGSAFVRLIAENQRDPALADKLGSFAAELKNGLKVESSRG